MWESGKCPTGLRPEEREQENFPGREDSEYRPLGMGETRGREGPKLRAKG